MAYYSSSKQYENTIGKRFSENRPYIHRTGSVRGMVKLGFICSNKTKEVDYNGWLLFVSEVFVCSDLITYLR